MSKTTSEQMRQWKGHPLFSYGFRPFFLFGAIWAALAMLIWILLLVGAANLPIHLDPFSWHAHEFLFGYLGAIIAGFLLTAVPNWTGRLPVVGWQLVGLFALWVLGRVALASSRLWPTGFAEFVDLLFPVVLGAVILREIIAGKNWRNLVVLGLLSIFTLANLVFHLEAASGDIAARGYGLRGGVSAVLMMVAVIGGRVVPSFTRNWLAQRKAENLPVPPMQRFDKATLLFTLFSLLLWTAMPHHILTGIALVGVGLAHLVRLKRWQGLQTGAEPLLWVLHLSYALLPMGAVFMAITILWPDPLLHIAAQHLWTAGTFGLMTLAMMTRATLGHTGQALHANVGTLAIYLLMVASVLVRVAAAIWSEVALQLYAFSGVLWISAFVGFAVAYGPCLLRPKPVRR